MLGITKWKLIDRTILVVFAILLGLMPFVNHLMLRTYSLDLGFYTHALYEYRQFRFADSDMLLAFHENHLASHFDFYLPLFSPLSWIFGTWTLLIIQWAAILWAGVGVRKYLEQDSPLIARLAQIGFYAFYGIHNALAFDYHSNVIAACIVPWLFISLKNQNFRNAWIWLILIWVGKENMSLWTTFIGLGWAISNWKSKEQRKWGLVASLTSVAYFLLVMGILIPSISQTDEYRGFLYQFNLGDTPGEAMVYVLTHPLEAFQYFFYHKLTDPEPAPNKMELFHFLLISGMGLLVFRPAWLLMIFPILAQKLWHDSPYMWGIGSQYSVEFAPILILGVFEMLARFPIQSWAKVVACTQLFGILAINWQNSQETIVYNEKLRLRIFQKEHYDQPAAVIRHVHRYMKNNIPEDASISAASPLVPHLAFRDNIYEFPLLRGAEHIILVPWISVYPIDPKCYDEFMEELHATKEWELIHNEGGLIHYRRK